MIPLPGMFATVRSRMAVIASVHPWSSGGEAGVTHLVEVEYKDDYEPKSEKLIWELEPRAVCQHPNRLPDLSRSPMSGTEFDAVLRAARWNATLPYIDPDGDGPMDRLPICSPLFGAVNVEDFQLVPLYKALAMPRVALLLADDVGLGKTIEAGLILSELISRRRIRRILILTPASLRDQWKDEMQEKFSLTFEMVDRQSTQRLRKEVGIDANPWRMHDRIITSYHYLKQPDVMEQFLSASRMPEGSATLPWDLVIVDECHNTMPSTFGENSDLCEAIRRILPLCEHRLFLSATPHNGHTRSFTGLLEMLDPVRFAQTNDLSDSAKERVKQVMVRRLKRTIDESSKIRRFCKRLPPREIELKMGGLESSLFAAFEEFRAAVHEAVAKEGRSRQLAGSFAVEIFGKRLISSPNAFADSWWRSREAFGEDDAATDVDVQKASASAKEDSGSDAETESREAVASKIVGSWLKNLSDSVTSEIAAIDEALIALGLGSDRRPAAEVVPHEDNKVKAVIGLIDRLCREDGEWRSDEGMVIFTEFKTSLDYLLERLRKHYVDDGRFLSLFGGMDDDQRRVVKERFNDASAEVRILVATDAASEGLNLQKTARYMLHFDCPWNPMRVEQRIGRLDRHGQGRDVEVFHFTSEQSADLRFLSRVINKVDQVREDLGSCGEIFDAALRRRLIDGESDDEVANELFEKVDRAKELCHIEADSISTVIGKPLAAITGALDLTPDTLRETLDTSLAWGGNARQLEPVTRPGAAPGSWRLKRESLPGWKEVIDQYVRTSSAGSSGAMRNLAFSPEAFITTVTGGLKVFQPRNDTVLMHLGHPLVRRGLHRLVGSRSPGSVGVSQWTVRRSPLPVDAEAVVLLSLEEIAVNALRETFHHWVKTIAFPIRNGSLCDPLPDKPAIEWSAGVEPDHPEDRDKAETLMSNRLLRGLQDWITAYGSSLTSALEEQLQIDREASLKDANQSFQSRSGELSALIQNLSIQRLENEIASLKADRNAPYLFDNLNKTLAKMVDEKEEELKRRERHLGEMRDALAEERTRVIERVIPKRYALGSEVCLFPVTLEVRLQGGIR
jgi:SNF2 family DNA or RNA helicase